MKSIRSQVTVTVRVDYEPGEWVVNAPTSRGEQEFTVHQQAITFTLWSDGHVDSRVTAYGSRRTKTGWHASETNLWDSAAEDWSAVRSEVMAELERALEAMKP